MNLKRIATALVIVAILGAAGFWAYRRSSAPDPEAAVADVNAVAVDTGVGLVSAEGAIVPLRHTALSFQVGGRVAEILAKEGDRVHTGDPLLRLDAASAESALVQAEAGLGAAQAGLSAAQTQLQSAQARVGTAELGVTAAQAQLALVKAGPLPEEVSAAESSLAAAEAAILQATGNRDTALEVGTDAQLRAAEAEVAAAAAQLQVAQDGYDAIIDACFTLPNGSEYCPLFGPVEENARAQLQAAQLAHSAAQTALEQLQAGATSAQRRAAEGVVSVAVAQRDAAQAQLDLLLAGARPELIRQAEVGVEQAELAVEQAQVTVAQAGAAVSQTQAGASQAQAARDLAQAFLDRMTLTAVFDGAVADISAELGQVVSPGAPVLILADTDTWLIETTDLTELDVVSVAVGLPVEASIDALPGETLTGRVSNAAAVSRLYRGDVTYAVTIDLDEVPDLPLRWGMTVFVNVDVGD